MSTNHGIISTYRLAHDGALLYRPSSATKWEWVNLTSGLWNPSKVQISKKLDLMLGWIMAKLMGGSKLQ
jgi:hypothetical protein